MATDVRMGWKHYMHQVLVTDTIALPANPKRRAIVLSSNNTQTYWFAFGEIAVVERGFAVNTATPFRKLRYRDFGQMICQDMHIIALAIINAPLTEVFTL